MTSYTGKEISSLRIGTVTAVRGRQIDVTVDVDKNDSSLIFQGEIISNVSIGSFLVVRRGYAHLVVQVEEEELVESVAWENSTYQRDVDRNTRILKTALLGEFETDTSGSPFQTRFVSGSQTSPLIGNIAYLASAEQASKIYVSTSKPDTQITIGHLATNSLIPINLDIITLFSSHIGIFGNTGSGKSYTLTQLYTQLLDKTHSFQHNTSYQDTHLLLFDFNGEYSFDSDHDRRSPFETNNIYGLFNSRGNEAATHDHLIPLSTDILMSEDFWTTLLEASENTQRPFIVKSLELLSRSRFNFWTIRSTFINFFTTRPKDNQEVHLLLEFLTEVHQYTEDDDQKFRTTLRRLMRSLDYNRNAGLYYANIKHDTYYANSPEFDKYLREVFSELFPNRLPLDLDILDNISIAFKVRYFRLTASDNDAKKYLHPLIIRLEDRLSTLRTWFKFTDDYPFSQPVFQIINLKYATLSERQLIPLILARAKYDEHKQILSLFNQKRYLNFIIDEAHNILSRDAILESDYWRNTRLETFEQIAKEGRKFGVFLTLASQRPADISPIITSQLHHFFLHRLVNPIDLDCVKNAVMFLDRNSFESIPSLPCGTCIISGTSVQIPAVVKIDELPDGRRPDNETIDLLKLWGLGADSADEGSELI